MNTLLHSKTEVHTPLADVHYNSPFGVQVRCGATWVTIPSEKLLADDLARPDLLDEFKANLDSEIDVDVHWHRFGHKIDKIDVGNVETAFGEIARLRERIEDFKQSIVEGAQRGQLTLAEARRLLGSLRCDDPTLRRVLARIVNCIPAREDSVEIPVPLRELTYREAGIACHAQGKWLEVPKTTLPPGFDLDPILEHVKRHLLGELTLDVKQVQLVKWDDAAERAQAATRTQSVTVADDNAPPAITRVLGDVKRLRAAAVAVPIGASFTLDDVRTSLGASSSAYSDRELHDVMGEILDRLPDAVWTVEETVPLSDLTYSPEGLDGSWNHVSFPVPLQQLGVVAESVPHKVLPLVAGTVTLSLDEKRRRWWNPVTGRLEFKPVGPSTFVDTLVNAQAAITDMKRLVRKIEILPISASLTLEDVRQILGASSSGYSDRQLRKLLSQIGTEIQPTACDDTEERLPLATLTFQPGRIICSFLGKPHTLVADDLRLVMDADLEAAKDHLVGDLIVQARGDCLRAWDPEAEVLRVALVDQPVAEIDQATLDGLVDQPAWTASDEQRSVSLAEVEFDHGRMCVPLNGCAAWLHVKTPFDLGPKLNLIKDVLADDCITFTIEKTQEFQWTAQEDGTNKVALTTSPWTFKGDFLAGPDTIAKLQKIHELTMLISDADPELPEEEVMNRVRKAGGIVDLNGRPFGNYDWEYFDYLVDLADEAFVSDIGTWFRIESDNAVVWERPEMGAATYVFCWPGDRLPHLVALASVWSLQNLRHNTEQTGFQGRALHANLSSWERNLRRGLGRTRTQCP